MSETQTPARIKGCQAAADYVNRKLGTAMSQWAIKNAATRCELDQLIIAGSRYFLESDLDKWIEEWSSR